MQTDKTFRIAKPMRKVSWTKRFAAGERSVGGRLVMVDAGRAVEAKEMAD